MKKKTTIKHHSGLKFFYRKIALLFAHFFYKIFGIFNPNIITNLGTLIHVIYLGLFVFYRNPLIFVLGIQLALILDYVDGSYARLTSQTTKFGKTLDGVYDVIKLFLTFIVLFYFTINDVSSFIVLVVLLLVFAINNSFKTMELHIRKNFVEEEDKKSKKESIFKTILKSPFGFTLTHFYAYFSMWLLFDNIYILGFLILIGLLSSFKTILDIFKIK